MRRVALLEADEESGRAAGEVGRPAAETGAGARPSHERADVLLQSDIRVGDDGTSSTAQLFGCYQSNQNSNSAPGPTVVLSYIHNF